MARAAAARATAVAGWAAASAMDRAEATATASPAVARASAARVTAAAGWVRPRAMATTAAAPARAGVIVAALTKRSRSRLLLLDDASSFSDDDLGVVVDVGGEVFLSGRVVHVDADLHERKFCAPPPPARPFVDARVEPRLQQLEAVFAPPTSSKIARIEDERAHNVPGAVLAALCAEELGRRTLTG